VSDSAGLFAKIQSRQESCISQIYVSQWATSNMVFIQQIKENEMGGQVACMGVWEMLWSKMRTRDSFGKRK
jgi:hypothetical protein